MAGTNDSCLKAADCSYGRALVQCTGCAVWVVLVLGDLIPPFIKLAWVGFPDLGRRALVGLLCISSARTV